MDSFKSEMQKKCAVGGIHCPCCNPYHASKNRNRAKQKLRRLARRSLDRKDKKEFDAEK